MSEFIELAHMLHILLKIYEHSKKISKMDIVHGIVQQRIGYLRIAQAAIFDSFSSGDHTHLTNLPWDVIMAVIYTLLTAQLVVIALSNRGRRLLFDVLDTCLAVVLICALLVIILGLPIGMMS